MSNSSIVVSERLIIHFTTHKCNLE
jgi:hypothetical protein